MFGSETRSTIFDSVLDDIVSNNTEKMIIKEAIFVLLVIKYRLHFFRGPQEEVLLSILANISKIRIHICKLTMKRLPLF